MKQNERPDITEDEVKSIVYGIGGVFIFVMLMIMFWGQ